MATTSRSMEAEYELVSDPQLRERGLTIAAVVTTEDDGRVRNEIQFRCAGRKASVHCVHTVIATIPVAEFERLLDAGHSGEEEIAKMAPVDGIEVVSIRPEEHFVALKSYVAGLAEFGLLSALKASYDYDFPGMQLGLNSMMQRQMIAALQRVAGIEITNDIVFDILSDIFGKCSDWVKKMAFLLDDVYDISARVVTSPHIAELIRERLPVDFNGFVARGIKRFSPLGQDFDEKITKLAHSISGGRKFDDVVSAASFLAGHEHHAVRKLAISTGRLPDDVIFKLLGDRRMDVRVAAVHKYYRKIVRRNPSVFRRLASDRAAAVKIALIEEVLAHPPMGTEMPLRLGADGEASNQFVHTRGRKMTT